MPSPTPWTTARRSIRRAHVAVYSPNHWTGPLIRLAINRSDRVRLPVHTRKSFGVSQGPAQ